MDIPVAEIKVWKVCIIFNQQNRPFPESSISPPSRLPPEFILSVFLPDYHSGLSTYLPAFALPPLSRAPSLFYGS